ncbi:alpha/beta hydrolase [Pseudomonas sp. 5P_3.1_Bac2]|nr:alpha/beta hydrolase [Pseudomonas sp. 5P_3.1_Bac2]MCU1715999.1 alpha/beta hydrolase [Pseudomonas sp. 5P_3.1_Bac2]
MGHWLRRLNSAAGWLAPHTAAEVWRRQFMTPRRLPPRAWELPVLEQGQRITLRFGLSALRWGYGPTVLLVHGWEGRPSQFAALIQALVDGGYSAVAIDGPGHGQSPGSEANLMIFANALLEAASDLPPLKAVIGHSMGGGSALLATQLGLRAEALVTIAAPSRIAPLLNGFSRYLGMPRQARAYFMQQVEAHVGLPVAAIDSARYQLPMPGLVVHAVDDRLVPYAQAQALHQNWPASRLLTLTAGGHQRVLADPQVLATVLEFLGSLQAPQRAGRRQS